MPQTTYTSNRAVNGSAVTSSAEPQRVLSHAFSSVPSGASTLDTFLADDKHDKLLFSITHHTNKLGNVPDVINQHKEAMEATITALEKDLGG